MSEQSATEVWIEFLNGPRDGEVVSLDANLIVIGRDADNNLQFAWDADVADRHAGVSRHGDQISIEDFGSGKETLVDGESLAGTTAVVEDTSIVRVGKTEFVCRRLREPLKHSTAATALAEQ
jgi:pSer/pThr/pTyr-binding forkhead associated (FHA) protein